MVFRLEASDESLQLYEAELGVNNLSSSVDSAGGSSHPIVDAQWGGGWSDAGDGGLSREPITSTNITHSSNISPGAIISAPESSSSRDEENRDGNLSWVFGSTDFAGRVEHEATLSEGEEGLTSRSATTAAVKLTSWDEIRRRELIARSGSRH
jgi:hypothetical protein